MNAITNHKYPLTHPLKTNSTLSHIFSYLEGHELGRFSSICRLWKKTIDQSEIWQALVNHCFNFSTNLDHHLWKQAFRHSFVFRILDGVQFDRQPYLQSGNWRISHDRIFNGATYDHIVVTETNKSLTNEYEIYVWDMDLIAARIDRDYFFGLNSKGVIYAWNYKNPEGIFNFRTITTTLTTLQQHSFNLYFNNIYSFTERRRFEVRNGYILLSYGWLWGELCHRSTCEIIPWMENRDRCVISVPSTLFISADCLEVERGWLYAFKGTNYLAWNLKKAKVQGAQDATTFLNIPFGHNGKFDFTFFNRGINYKNLLFSIFAEGQDNHIVVRDLNLKNEVVKTFAKCRTEDGAINTALFFNLLMIGLTPQKRVHL